MELARGQIADRPWGRTLGTLAVRRHTGQLTLHAADGKTYCLAFEHGMLIGATSPLAADSATRVALTSSLITSSQVMAIARTVAAHPDQDELDVVARACALDADRALRLRRRVLAQRGARTFSVDAGSFVIEDRATIATATLAPVDVRAVVYLGARANLSDVRLTEDLRRFGSHFALADDAIADLPRFEMTAAEHPIIEALRHGATLPEIEAAHRQLDPRLVHAVVYALVSCSACAATQPAARPRAPSLDGIFIKPAVPARSRIASGTQPPTSDPIPTMARTATPPYPPPFDSPDPPASTPPVVSRATTPPFTSEEGSGSRRVIDPLATAAEAFLRGQSALHNEEIPLAIAELTTAAELNPHEFEFHATLAWAQFCGATDKTRSADKVRKMLGHAIQKSVHPEIPRFYLGRMERMLGHDREALRHFQEILAAQPQHAEAASEARTIEARLAAGSGEKPGLSSLFSRKKP